MPATSAASGTRSQSSSARSSSAAASPKAWTDSAAVAARTLARSAARWSPAAAQWWATPAAHRAPAGAAGGGGVGRPALERLGERVVQLGALAGQQVVDHDLAQQRVAEGVAVVVGGDDEVAGDRLAQGGEERRAVHAADLGDQRVVDALADREHAQDLLGGIAELLEADHQRVAEVLGQRAAAVDAGGEQLLHEKRVALAARVQTLDEVAGRSRAEDVLERRGQLVARQALHRDAPDRRVALDLGEQRAQRVAAVHLVEAVGEDDEHALAAERVGEEGDERARR